MNKNVSFRLIAPEDNEALALIVRNTLMEFGAAKPGTVYFDPSTDHLFELFKKEGAAYFVAEWNDKIVGGAGIFPTEGLPADTCELVKMYLIPEARGKGIGRRLIEKCKSEGKQLGYKRMYLETLPELKQALKLYEHSGFVYINAPLGNSGHFGCDRWMIKEI